MDYLLDSWHCHGPIDRTGKEESRPQQFVQFTEVASSSAQFSPYPSPACWLPQRPKMLGESDVKHLSKQEGILSVNT